MLQSRGFNTDRGSRLAVMKFVQMLCESGKVRREVCLTVRRFKTFRNDINRNFNSMNEMHLDGEELVKVFFSYFQVFFFFSLFHKFVKN